MTRRKFPDWMMQEYYESRRDPRTFMGPMRRCPDCDVLRNQRHTDNCSTQVKKDD